MTLIFNLSDRQVLKCLYRMSWLCALVQNIFVIFTKVKFP